MSWSQIIGLGGLALLAVLGFWLMSGGRKIKPDRRSDTDSIGGGFPGD